MPTEPLNLNPRGGGLGGDEIGLSGSLVPIRPQKIIPRFVQPILESSRFNQRYPAFIASRLVYGSFTIKGLYLDGLPKDALKIMVQGTVLTDCVVRLGATVNARTGAIENQRGYRGTVIVKSSSPSLDYTNRNQDANIPYDIDCQFSGQIDLLSASYSFSQSESWATTDIRQGWTATIGYQDERQDLIRRPFILTGVDEATTDPYDALGLVIGSLGGVGHTYHGLSLLRGTASWSGRSSTAWARGTARLVCRSSPSASPTIWCARRLAM